MKKFKLITVLVILVTISSTVWGQAGKNFATYTIDGGDFHHQVVTINSNPKAMENGAWTSFAGSNYLKINLGDSTPEETEGPKWSLDIAFNRIGTGTAKVNDPIENARIDHRVYFLLDVQINGQSYWLMSDSKKPAQTPGTITITKLGPVGGTVEGAFEGKLIGHNITYTVTGGHFIVTRKLQVHPH
jgi:hypothetical protein